MTSPVSQVTPSGSRPSRAVVAAVQHEHRHPALHGEAYAGRADRAGATDIEDAERRAVVSHHDPARRSGWWSLRSRILFMARVPLSRASFNCVNETFAVPIGRNISTVPHYERRRHIDSGESRRPLLGKVEHDMHGLLGHLGNRDADCGQRRSCPSGDLEVVESDHRQLRGDCHPERPRRLVHAECLDVGGGEDRRRRHGHGEERAPLGESVAVVKLPAPHVLRAERDARGLKRGSEAGQPGRRGHHVLRAR